MSEQFNQRSLHRLIQMMVLMNEPISIRKLAETIGIGQRSVYRYLHLLQKSGFQIEKEFHRYQITYNPIVEKINL